ncbi:MAG: alpha/beta fold hydrolase [Pseudomonadales bacterium]
MRPSLQEQGISVSMTSYYGEPQQRRATLDGVELCYFEWGDPAGQDLLLVHATGFHARCWDQVVARLPAGLHIVAPETRGHGRSARTEPYSWANFGGDLIDFAKFIDLQDALAVGHSMGGHCVAQLAIAQPDRLRALLLIDPVIFAPDAYPSERHEGFASVADHPVARRRNHWPDWQAMQTSLVGKGSFGLWDPAVLEDYCRYGSLPVADGVELACPPTVEASVYMGSSSTDLHEQLGSVLQPALVLRAPARDPASTEMDFSKSPTWPQLAAVFPNGRDELLADLTHFIPMQDPALVANRIESLLA